MTETDRNMEQEVLTRPQGYRSLKNIVAFQPRYKEWVEVNETRGGWLGEKSHFQVEAGAVCVKAQGRREPDAQC